MTTENTNMSSTEGCIPEYIGAINRSNGHQYLAMIVGGLAIGLLMTDVVYEGVSTEKDARTNLQTFINEKWELMSEEEVEATGLLKI